MLLVVAHPVVGAGLETLLRIERRFDVRRVASLAEAASLTPTWRADVALVDGLLLQNRDLGDLGVPSYVLSGNEADGKALERKLADAQGWLRKDATAEELAAVVDRSAPPSRDRGQLLGAAALTVVLTAALALLLWWGWLALSSAG